MNNVLFFQQLKVLSHDHMLMKSGVSPFASIFQLSIVFNLFKPTKILNTQINLIQQSLLAPSKSFEIEVKSPFKSLTFSEMHLQSVPPLYHRFYFEQ